jgi:uncharacterized paraquat-inducible protein A
MPGFVVEGGEPTMEVKVQCPQCGSKISLPKRYRGKVTRCPECQGSLPVPGGTTTALMHMLKVSLLVCLLVAALAGLKYLLKYLGLTWQDNW